jgi:hypothetical protein
MIMMKASSQVKCCDKQDKTVWVASEKDESKHNDVRLDDDLVGLCGFTATLATDARQTSM